jgi:hypothetical protein
MYILQWAAYAISQCLEIEKAVPEADRWMNKFEAGCEEYRIYMSKQKQSDKPARYGVDEEWWKRNPSSSIIVVSPYSSMGGA